MKSQQKAVSRQLAKSTKAPAKSMTREEMDAMVHEMIGRIADKWTMLVLETLEEHGCLRFTQLAEHVSGVSQKMLTKTLRQMEFDGLVKRTVYPVIPPHVEYELTKLGKSLGEAFCGVWMWVEKHHGDVTKARREFTSLTNTAIPAK
jgi:DNA-binding HxlR family transcriptional regulator